MTKPNTWIEVDETTHEVWIHEVTDMHHNRYRVGWFVGNRRIGSVLHVFVPNSEYHDHFPVDINNSTLEGIKQDVLDEWNKHD